jgi:hypothetical protein
MALTRSIISLITDGEGFATKDFLTCSPAEWADAQMIGRYSQARLPGDAAGEFPYQCWEHLCEEYLSMRRWFDTAGKLNPMMQNAALVNRLSGPIGDGIGWDFKTNGDPELRMCLFKGQLIAATRAISMIPAGERTAGRPQMGGLATIVRSAYGERMQLHRWSGTADPNFSWDDALSLLQRGRTRELEEKIKTRLDSVGDSNGLGGQELGRRWVANMSYTFLIRLGAERKWAWDVSKCKVVFGPTDEEKGVV